MILHHIKATYVMSTVAARLRFSDKSMGIKGMVKQCMQLRLNFVYTKCLNDYM